MQCDWVPHNSSISSKIPFNHSSSLICSPTNHTICDDHTLRSFRKAWVEWTHNSHRAIMSLASAILVVHPLSTSPIFSFLCGALSTSLSSTWRVSILGKDNELPRKSGVAGAVGSGTGGMIFNIDATSWSGGICITTPVGWTTIWLATDDAHNTSHSPGAFPFVSTALISFLLPIHPNNLLLRMLAYHNVLLSSYFLGGRYSRRDRLPPNRQSRSEGERRYLNRCSDSLETRRVLMAKYWQARVKGTWDC